MPLGNTEESWGAVAKTFHWLIAVLVLCMIGLGLWAVNAPLGPLKLKLFAVHKAVGIIVFAVMVLRLIWRSFHKAPILPPGLPGWERVAASANHWLLYGLVLVMPISGYVVTSAADFPVNFFGWQVPMLIAKSKPVQDTAESVHVTGFYILAVLIVLHIAAALRHHFILKDRILMRMLPGGASRGEGAGL